MSKSQPQSSQQSNTLPQTPLQRLLRYSLAVVAVVAAMGARLALTAWVGPELPPYITFFPAIMVVALLTGLGPGLLATALVALSAAYWILPPNGISITSPVDRLGLVIFISMGLGMSVLAELYQRQKRKAAAYQCEVALRDTKARLATFAEATFEGIVESEAGRIVDCNEQFALISGYPVAELRGMEIADLIDPEDRDRVLTNIRQQQESITEHAMLRKDGTRIVVEVHGRLISPETRTRFSAIRDITERKQAEQAARQTKEEWERTFNSVPDLIAILQRSTPNRARQSGNGRAAELHARRLHRPDLLLLCAWLDRATTVLSARPDTERRKDTYGRGARGSPGRRLPRYHFPSARHDRKADRHGPRCPRHYRE